MELENFLNDRPDHGAALSLSDVTNVTRLCEIAAAIRDSGHGSVVTYSPKVFIPLTQLCRDVCHYCTFAKAPGRVEAPYLTPEQALDIARAGVAAGCHEALFTLGDKPELRYAAARDSLASMGHATTIDYLVEMALLVHAETGLLPHVNPGVTDFDDLHRLRKVSVSQGLMLESASSRLCAAGGPHHGSPDKLPAARLTTLDEAGQLRIPMTSGILIGIGETRRERIEALLALRDLDDAHGHIQEVIIQNFRRKPGTKMANTDEPSLEELCWTVAVARIIFGPDANIQAPPNLSPHGLRALVNAGISDLGGISPVTQDHVNPEAPWPHLRLLARETEIAGKLLTPRLAVYPKYVQGSSEWIDPALQQSVRDRVDASGLTRTETWFPGADMAPPKVPDIPDSGTLLHFLGSEIFRHTEKAARGNRLDEREVTQLFETRGAEFRMVCAAADELRVATKGDVVTYIRNCNINYTNICAYKCQFCAFSKGKSHADLRGKAYNLSLEDIQEKSREAWQRGAIEVCLQGGIHPAYTGQTYLDICEAIKAVLPAMHIHAFSPLEIWQGAKTLGLRLPEYLSALKAAGLGSVPGTAAEILVPEIRAVLCPDKVTVDQWIEVMRAVHGVGLRSTATIMFGHIEQPVHWAKHLLLIRDLQAETGGFTEFVPLPFVHMESPLYRRGRARQGPTFREAVLMHAVARLALHAQIDNIQTSWVKMGRDGVSATLQAGANDLGGTLMYESISRAAGASHGQEMTPGEMDAIIAGVGRIPVQRNTLYHPVSRKDEASTRSDRYLAGQR